MNTKTVRAVAIFLLGILSLGGTKPIATGGHPCQKLLKLAPVSYEYKGLTKEGIKALQRARDAVRERVKIFEGKFRNMNMIHRAGMLARLTKGNMFLYGPPGGAKSKFVDWMLSGEAEEAYRLQLHQMVTEQAFLGKQTFEKGRFDIDTDSGLAVHTNALFDEIDKGNPAALASVLGVLNERKLLLGKTVIDTRLETVFSTSNANLPEILQQFLENGQGSTAPALLNRFQFKAFVYNWLDREDQIVLDNLYRREMYLEAFKDAYPEVMDDQIFLNPPLLDWSELRQMAHGIFVLGPSWDSVYLSFIDEMRAKTIRAIRESEELHKQDPREEPFVYFPSADFTERFRREIPKVVIMSAFVDFLLSPLADNESLAHVTAKPIVLDYLSLWRSSIILSTVGPGEIRLTYNPQDDQKIDIDFGWSIDPSGARDRREELLIENLKKEQERFRQVFLNYFSSVREQIELRARHKSEDDFELSTPDSFEILLLRESLKED